jgi:hypothetical protein
MFLQSRFFHRLGDVMIESHCENGKPAAIGIRSSRTQDMLPSRPRFDR